MEDLLAKFIKSIKNLENYYILKEDSNHLAIGTMITIKKHHEVMNNVFQPYSKDIDVSLHVLFIIPLKTDFPELKDFRKRKIPILVLPTRILFSKDPKFCIKECLEDFIKIKIINAMS